MKKSRAKKLRLWAWWLDYELDAAYAAIRKRFGRTCQVL